MQKQIAHISALTILLCFCTVFTGLFAQVITDFTPASVSAGTGSQVTINGSGFGAGPASATRFVEFADADNGGTTGVKPALIQYAAWSDNQIIVIIPDGAGTGAINVTNGSTTGVSTSKLTISYALLNSGTFSIKHVNKNGLGGYTWQLEKAFDANSSVKNSFLKSLSAWKCLSGINWSIGVPTPANQTGNDGINIVRFDTGDELPPGVLGVAYTYYRNCGGNNWEITESDLVFDKERNWNFEDALPTPSQSDFQSVVLHELGHAHNLGHVIDASDLMHYAIAAGTSRRNFSQGNTDGARNQVNLSSNPSGGICTAAMNASIPTTCGFAYPKVSAFSPSQAGADATVTITGQNLSTTSAVSFGGIAAKSFVVVSNTEVKAVLASGTSGEVSLTTSGGIAVLNNFIFLAPPVITSYSPTFGWTGDTILISGTNLSSTKALSFGGKAAASFKVLDDNQVKGVLADGDSGIISLSTEAGDATTPGFVFSPKIMINSFSPLSGKRGDTILINGQGFRDIQSIKFGTQAVASFRLESAFKIYAVLGLGESGAITINSSFGTTSKDGFLFYQAPKISSFNPIQAAEETSVIIKGSNFNGATEVLFGGTAATSFKVISDSEITAIAGTGESGDVSVKTPGGTAVKSGFTFLPTLRILSFSPKIATTDQKIIIKGSDFRNVIGVSLGGVAAKSFTVDALNTITATVGSGASGAIKIQTSDGQVSASGFVFVYKPRVDNFRPAAAGFGSTVLINGVNFEEITSVQFGNTEASSFKILSPTAIEAVVATGTSGVLKVSNPGGNAEISGFTFIPAPVIASVDPLLGTNGTELNIKGLNFSTVHAVTIGNKAAASFRLISPEQITAIVADEAGDGAVNIATGGGSVAINGFRYIPPPLLSSFSPQNAIAGVNILISGSNFSDINAISFGGKAAASFKILSATSIEAVVAPGSSSGSLKLTSPGGTISMDGFVFTYTLPASNFSISGTDLTCKASSNGIIGIRVQQNQNYTATISAGGKSTTHQFTNDLEVKNLSAGIYTICMTLADQPTFKQCFELPIREPKDLSLYSYINKDGNILNLTLDGSENYFVELNGSVIKTSSNELSMSLKGGLNTLKVYTSQLCQGILERTFLVDAVKVYPNPFDTNINLILGSEYIGNINIEIRNLAGKLVYSKTLTSTSEKLQLNVEDLIPGTYLLQISSGGHRSVHKLLKR